MSKIETTIKVLLKLPSRINLPSSRLWTQPISPPQPGMGQQPHPTHPNPMPHPTHPNPMPHPTPPKALGQTGLKKYKQNANITNIFPLTPKPHQPPKATPPPPPPNPNPPTPQSPSPQPRR